MDDLLNNTARRAMRYLDELEERSVVPSPTDVTREKLQEVLWPKFEIEVPLPLWNDEPLIRVSVQAYNTPEDRERLLGAIEKYL